MPSGGLGYDSPVLLEVKRSGTRPNLPDARSVMITLAWQDLEAPDRFLLCFEYSFCVTKHVL